MGIYGAVIEIRHEQRLAVFKQVIRVIMLTGLLSR